MAYKPRDSLKNVKPGKPIEEVAREFGIKEEIVKLASNENPLGPSPKAIKVIKDKLNNLNYYPDDTAFYLSGIIAERFNVSRENVIVSNGSAELIMLSVLSHLEQNNNLVMGWPGFVLPKIVSAIMGAEVKQIKTRSNYYHDIEKILSSIDPNTVIVYIDNPTNPLGTFLDKDKILYLAEKVPEDKILIIDQAYFEYLEKDDFISHEKLLSERKNILILQTFSKIYGLAGLRIGYGIGNKELIENIRKVKIPFNVNSLAQLAATEAIKDETHVKNTIDLNLIEKKFISNGLKERSFKVVDSFTNFITFDLGEDSDKFNIEMLKKGVIIRPLKPYGLETMVRVTTGTRENSNRFFKALDDISN